MTPRFKVAVQIRLRQLPGTGYNGAVRLRVKQEDKVARCWDAIFCGEERADDKHLAVRQPGNAPKNCVVSQDYRGRIALWPAPPSPARQGEVRSPEMARCNDRRCRGSRERCLGSGA